MALRSRGLRDRRRLRAAAAGVVALAVLTAGPPAVAAATLVVTIPRDTVDADPGNGLCADVNGDCTLRAAIQEANASPEPTTIVLDNYPGDFRLSIEGEGEDQGATGDLDVTGQILLEGEDSVVKAKGSGLFAPALDDRAFDVHSGARLEVRNLSVKNGRSATGGGAFRSAGELSLSGVRVSNNIAYGTGASGGGVLVTAGRFQATDTEFDHNSAAHGGGIEASAGTTTTLTRVVLRSNATSVAEGEGGGMHVTGAGTVAVTDSLVEENTAAAEGGGLWNSATATMTVAGTRVVGNRVVDPVAEGGGALFNAGGNLVVTASRIDYNEVLAPTGSGGAILNDSGAVTVSGSLLKANSAPHAGGAIAANGGTTNVDTSEVAENTTGEGSGNGGGLHLTGAGTVDVARSNVSFNAAREGGGLWNSSTGTMTVTDTILKGNTAAGGDLGEGGGGLVNDGGTLTIRGGLIKRNAATGALGSGGGILSRGTLDVSGTDIQRNTAVRAGGGIEASGATSDARLERVVLRANAAGPEPGNGGGLHVTGAGRVDIVDSRVTDNAAAREGGGLWNSATGTMTVLGTLFDDNAARPGGGPNAYQEQGGNGLTVDDEPVAPGDPGI